MKMQKSEVIFYPEIIRNRIKVKIAQILAINRNLLA